jgi:hypothetical protein
MTFLLSKRSWKKDQRNGTISVNMLKLCSFNMIFHRKYFCLFSLTGDGEHEFGMKDKPCGARFIWQQEKMSGGFICAGPDAVFFHDLLEGLALETAFQGCMGDVSFRLIQNMLKIGNRKLLHNLMLSLVIGK